ncbi:hypothetical protein QTO34_015630 [Cnephaeus nilssonii]|uniref:Myeloid-derived growth factor n=1 Tax=Cnephaeus nilssonii TaxID=3371016 RepID=A0AA40I4G7_CNENI|nr:hypothetical protein QTO34_015630 [Eptesicus nilssonii]
MAAPSGRRNRGDGASLWAALLLAAVALRPAEAVSEPTTVAFDVRPGGVVHTFSQNVGPGDKYTCVFTYASQGGTNEKWQMSLGTSEDQQHFTCTIWRPQGKSYLYFTQFKAEVRGAEIEYGMAYSKAAFEKESDVPLKNEEFEVTKTAVSHRPGAFKAELSKLVIVAKVSRKINRKISSGEDLKRKRKENLFEEVMMGNFPTLAKEADIQCQEVLSLKEAHTKTHNN